MARRILPSLALLALAACPDNRSSVAILGRAFPSDLTSCKFSDSGELWLGPGTLDTSFVTERRFGLVVYVENELADPSEITPGATPAGKAWRAQAARVRVNSPDYITDFPPVGSAMLNLQSEVRIPLDGLTIMPGDRSAQWVDAINAALGAQMAAVLPAGARQLAVLGITLEGDTLDGAKLDTGEWYYPVYVCDGCLAVCAAGAICPDPATGTCTAGLPGGGSCGYVGQDVPPFCG
jgi:hypothetical protein